VLFGEDGIRWGALTVLLILLNDFSKPLMSFKKNESTAGKKLLEDLLSGNYTLNVDLFLYPEKRRLKSYINGRKVEEFELDLIRKFIEDTSEYIFPAVERLSDGFVESLRLQVLLPRV